LCAVGESDLNIHPVCVGIAKNAKIRRICIERQGC